MSIWRYFPAFKLVPNAQLVLPSGGTAGLTTNISGFGYLTGTTLKYKYAAAYDGGGQFHTAQSASWVTATGSPSSNSCFVTFPPTIGARWYFVWRSLDGTERLVYSGPGPAETGLSSFTFIDGGGTVDAFSTSAFSRGYDYSIFASDTSATTVVYNLSPLVTGGSAAFRVDATTASNPINIGTCFVRSVEYVDQSEPGTAAVNRSLVAKEFGVRPVVRLGFSVEAASAAEDILATIYGAKLAYPDASGKGIKTYFTLNYNHGTPLYREVRIFGNFPRNPGSGKNVRNEFEWELQSVNVIPSVPAYISAASGGVW